VTAALGLFAQRGVGGTSLQMIADSLGVTKAAVYHQFRTKDEIVLAAAEAELGRLEAALEAAEAEPSRARARQVLVAGIVDLAVEGRNTTSIILSDPVIRPFFAGQERFRRVIRRLAALLMDDGGGSEGRITTAMFIAAVSGAVMHPLVAGLDDDVLRSQLLRMAHRLLGPDV